mgnify:FL=1
MTDQDLLRQALEALNGVYGDIAVDIIKDKLRERLGDDKPLALSDVLTKRQCEILNAYVETGHYKRAAQRLGIRHQNVADHMTKIKERTGHTSHVLLAIAWDREIRKGDDKC